MSQVYLAQTGALGISCTLMSGSAEEKKALDERFSSVYDQLRKIARSMLRRGSSPALTATAVVHEAYARLAISGSVPDVTESSFKRIAAHVMREVLCDAARRYFAQKRGSGQAIGVIVDDSLQDKQISIERILVLNNFLDQLQTANERQSSVVELLFFGGLTLPEVAAELGTSVSTVERDWRAARAWLSTEALRTGTSKGLSP